MADQADGAEASMNTTQFHPEEDDDVDTKIKAHLHVGSEVSQSKYRYNMRHARRGELLVINNKDFSSGMPYRLGADVDATYIVKTFKALGFDVTLLENLTCVEMRNAVKEAAGRDHSNADCFCCIILSHGEGNDVIHGTDTSMKLDLLFAPFRGCQSMLSKPKIFIVQACRGEDMDEGARIQSDAVKWQDKDGHKIPLEADFLYVYSSVAGYRSFRNAKVGSYFIRALCYNVNHYKNSHDLLWILTRVNYTLAHEFQSRCKDPDIDKKKQVSSFVSMLTKELYLCDRDALSLEDVVG